MSIDLRRSLAGGLVALTAVVALSGCFPDPQPLPPTETTTTTTSTTTSTTTTSTTTTTAPVPVFTVKINEVESSGGTPGDWIELINLGPDAADVSGWTVVDNDITHTPAALPAGTVIPAGGYYVVEESLLGFGLGGADSATLANSGGTVDSYSWTAHASSTYGRCPNGTGAFATTASSTKGSANLCQTAATTVKVNEVESSGGTPGDWIELINTGANAADISGWTVLDNDDTHTPSTIPAGTVIAAGGYYIVEESALGFGLGSADSARVFDTTATIVDSYSWTAHAALTWGRCPDGTGAFGATSSTKGAANACVVGPTTTPWPGGSVIQTVDVANTFGTNMSGLIYEGSGTATPGTLWAVRNGPGTLHRLISDGTTWAPDSGDWAAGKALRYPNGLGNPDAEGVTFTGTGSAGGIFVATERNNDANGVSRNSILRFDPNTAGTSLTATNEWNLTADLPVVGPNLGMEAITWVPDSELVSEGFVDQVTGTAYNPATYANHGDGLFFIGLEANGTVYAYALDLVGGGFTKVATISSGFTGVMDLQYDRDLQNLWAVCDDGCQGRSTVLGVNASGAYVPGAIYDRPSSMPNINNEGFAIAAATECVADRKPAFWSDDNNTDGHAIRSGTISCSTPVS